MWDFFVDTLAVGQLFIQVLWFSEVSITPPVPHPYLYILDAM